MSNKIPHPSDHFRILVTGAGGFVGAHLVDALGKHFGECAKVLGTTLNGKGNLEGQTPLDVTDGSAVSAAFNNFRPTHVIHLAALSAIKDAEQKARAAWDVNLVGTLNVADAIQEHCPDAVLISISSAQVYGFTANQEPILTEESVVRPANIYGVTKASADLALAQMATTGLNTLILRPFNHTGPGQEEAFAIPSFAAQIAKIEAGQQPPVIRVGNLDSTRDFLDVGDVVDAYCLAVEKAGDISSGTIVNIASGTGHRMSDVLDQLKKMSKTSISVEFDITRSRSNDIPSFVGDPSKATQLLGWKPTRPLDQTLFGILEYFRHKFRAHT
eukprot:s1_g1450.t1